MVCRRVALERCRVAGARRVVIIGECVQLSRQVDRVAEEHAIELYAAPIRRSMNECKTGMHGTDLCDPQQRILDVTRRLLHRIFR
jgi:hypothetical protein